MGFSFVGGGKARGRGKELPVEMLRDLRCQACPLDASAKRLKSPKIDPSGTTRPIFYFLAGAPSDDADAEGANLSRSEKRKLRDLIPDWALNKIRYHNIVRCSTANVNSTHLACCGGFIEEDIARTKPEIIVGFGKPPLSWVTNESDIMRWRGRMLPVTVGGHTCWYFSALGFEAVMNRKGGNNSWDLIFELDLLRLFDDYDRGSIPEPEVVSSEHKKGITIITGQEPDDFDKLKHHLSLIQQQPEIGFDLETVGLKPYKNESRILTVAAGTSDHTVAFALDHPLGWPDHRLPAVTALFVEFLITSNKKICHNLKFEQEWIGAKFGTGLLRRTEWADTLLMAHTLDERYGKDLDMLVYLYFGFKLKPLSPVNVANLLYEPIEDTLLYNGLDAKWTHALHSKLDVKLRSVPKLQRVYQHLLRSTPTLVNAMVRGVPVSINEAETQGVLINNKLRDLEAQIASTPEVQEYENVYGVFSPSNSNNTLVLLKDVLKRTEVFKTDREGNEKVSSDESVISSLPVDEVPSAPLILQHRALSKIESTYIRPIVERKIVYEDGKLHTNYNLTTTVTGRLSSDDPNLQNFPKRKNKEVRKIIQAPEGFSIASLDYGQIEARVIGMASEDKNLVKALWTSFDIHMFWSEWLAKKQPSVLKRIAKDYAIDRDDSKSIMKALRSEIKNTWVFPQFYGSSFKSCARAMHVELDIAEEMSKEFWGMFDGVLKWQEKVLDKYDRVGYVETLTGRRRRGVMSRNEAINSPIQGTASDIVVDAMNRTSEYAEVEEDDQFQALMNIHDDLTFFLRDSTLNATVHSIAEMMCKSQFDFINCPLVVEASVGKTWYDQKEIAVFRSDVDFK